MIGNRFRGFNTKNGLSFSENMHFLQSYTKKLYCVKLNLIVFYEWYIIMEQLTVTMSFIAIHTTVTVFVCIALY